jgi:autotransporter-associated beta strand protein
MKTQTLLLLGMLVLGHNVHAAERTWTGSGGNSLWSNPNNWSPTGVPQNGDDLNFFNICPLPFGCPTFTVINDLSNLLVGELRFGDPASGNVEYVVNGNPLRLTRRVLIGIATGDDTPLAVVTLNCPLVLENNLQFQVAYGGWGGFPTDGRESRLFLNGAIDLNGHDLAVVLAYNQQNSRSRVDIAGTISGAGSLSIDAGENCTARFNGTADNTFTGTLTFSGVFDKEKLIFDKTGGAVTHGRLVIGGVCRWERPHQIGDEATVVVTDQVGTEAGKLYLQGHDETIRALEFQENGSAGGTEDGLLDTGGGVLTVLDRISADSDAGTPVLRGRLAVPSDLALDINGTEFYGLDLQAYISGAGDLTKTGNAALILSGNSTYTGWLFVESGAVEPRTATALGSVNRGVSLRNGTLRLISLTISGESLYSQADGATLFSMGTSTWAGEIRLEQDLQIYGENLTHAHVITGPGGLSLLGATITLAGLGQNTFTGATEVRCELLRLNKASNTRAFSGPLIIGGGFAPLHEIRWLNNFQFPPGANVTVHPNGLLALNDFTDIASNLTFNGGHVNLATDSALQLTGTVTANPTNTTALIDGATGLGSFFLSGQRPFNIGDGSIVGPDLRIDARIAGSGITKLGAGTLALGGNNAFGGPVNVGNGILRVDHDNGLGTIGSGTMVSNGATLFLATAADLVREPVTLNGTGFGGTNGALAAVGGVILSNNVVLAGASTIRVDFGALNIFGTISGTGPLTKTGDGALTFLGTANNTYSGDTLVNAGTLQLDKSDFLQAVPGNLVIGTGGFFPTPATVRHFSQDQIWANVTVNAGSLLDLNGYEEYLVALTLNGGGDVQTGAGLLTVDGGNSITVNPGLGSATSTISGRLGLRTGNHNINVAPFLLALGGPELDIAAQVILYNGIANIHKNGAGDMRLGAANTFTGVLYVDGGRVIAAHNSALGTAQGSTVVQTNGSLVLDGGITTSEVLILDTAAPIALSSMSGSNTVTTNINLLRASTGIEVRPAAGVLQVRGRVGSVGGLTKLGPGTLQFFGSVANDYTGLTVISNGVLEASRGNLLGQSFRAVPGDFIVGDDSTATTTASLRLLQGGQLAPGADATLRRSGLLNVVPRVFLPNTSARLRTVTGAGRINLGSGTSLIISNDVSFDFDGSISGAGALNKYGRQASMHFTGDSTFSGPTTIYEGFYRMDGNAPNSPVTVKLDASLRGDGLVGNLTVESGGFVSPNSEVPGHHGADLQMSSANFLPGGILNLALYGPHQTGGNDSLLVNGPVTLGGTRLSSGFQYAPREGDVITLIRKTTAGAITGTFTGFPEGAQRLHGEIPVVMSYVGGDGNDVTLTVTNLAAGPGGSQVTSGNGNGFIEPDECNLLFLGVQNRRNAAITLSNVVLRSTTPSALVTIASAAYPVIPAGSIRSNLTPFQIRTLPTHPCGAAVTVELQVTIVNEGTFAIPFALPGGASCNNGGGACESCTLVSGTFTTDTPTLYRRLFATGAPSVCSPEKPCPGPDDGTNLPPARYIKHTFTNTTGSEACLSAQLHFDCPTAPVGALHVAAYLGDVDPADVCPNFLGDTGAATPDAYPPFSFRVPAGSNFVLVVSTRVENIGCDSYWIELFGLPCPPPRLHIADDTAPGNARLHWSTAYPGWSLQSVNSLHSPGSNVFSDVLTPPVVVEGQYTVTNTTALPHQFFRLMR